MEIWRANIEAQLAELTAGTSPETTISKMAEIWDPDIEVDATESPAMDLQRVYRGRDEARQFWQEWFTAWDTLRYEYELVDAGESVVVLLDLHMRGRSTGIEMPHGKFAWVGRFRGGLVVHAKMYTSQSEALKAAGLPDSQM